MKNLFTLSLTLILFGCGEANLTIFPPRSHLPHQEGETGRLPTFDSDQTATKAIIKSKGYELKVQVGGFSTVKLKVSNRFSVKGGVK